MRAPFEMTQGLDKLRETLATFPADSPHWNEAENRFHFIDVLLTDCLGWERPDISVERTDEGGGRSDYVLGHPAKAVLEAKRESKQWEVLPSGNAQTVRKIEPLIAASKNFKEVVTQVISYCGLRGAPIAIVCNGPQLAVFQALTVGEEPLKGECYLFNGFADYIEQFPLLWTLLSPEGITENRALRSLSRHRNPRIPAKASQSIPEPYRYRYRDHLQTELRSVGSFLLEEIEDNPKLRDAFFKDCYVPIEANNRHLLLSKQIIASRYRRVSDDNTGSASLDRVTNTGVLDNQFFTNTGSRPVVVIGDVGVGKSSFFENLQLNVNSGKNEHTIFLRIDLGITANLADGLKSYIMFAMSDDLYEQYEIDIEDAAFVQAIYHKELTRFDKSVDGEIKTSDPVEYAIRRRRFLLGKTERRDAHLHQALAHISRGRSRRIVLIIDNADQRSFDTQQEAFLIAQEFAATRSLHVFVALRPSTFYLSKTAGALSAYQNKILTISPPPADTVIERRIVFALRIAEGKTSPANLDNIRLNLPSIVWFLTATLRSIRRNQEIRQFLGNITGGNTKAVIELISSFCGSPNVDAKKIVDIESVEKDYIVPVHEFTKHALLGEYSYFNQQSSFVACNVFDVSAADAREHFLSCLIIGYLSSNIGTKNPDGFVSGEAVKAEMVSHGFNDDQISSCLRRLAIRKMIETPYSHFRELEVDDTTDPSTFYFRATSVGIYHIRYWIGSFAFLDAVSTDTPIFDEGSRSTVSKLAASFEIAERFKKTVAFRAYLEARWHLANIHVNYFDFPNVLASHAAEFGGIERVSSRPRKSVTRTVRRIGKR